jgi:hypothetical protein
MNEAGVFGRFIPDFGRVVAQMQYDMYHVYTVDEHTLFAIGILHKIEHGRAQGRAAARHRTIAPTIVSRRALYVATCCTTSPRDAAATIPRSARRSRSSWARAGPDRRGDRDGRLAGALT